MILPTWAVRAGARKTILYEPSRVQAAIVTCGGLCPGLNDVVQGLVKKLSDYGVPDGNIKGIRYAPPLFRQSSHEEASCLRHSRWQHQGQPVHPCASVFAFHQFVTQLQLRLSRCRTAWLQIS